MTSLTRGGNRKAEEGGGGVEGRGGVWGEGITWWTRRIVTKWLNFLYIWMTNVRANVLYSPCEDEIG